MISAALGEKVGDHKEPATSYHLQNKGNLVEEDRSSKIMINAMKTCCCMLVLPSTSSQMNCISAEQRTGSFFILPAAADATTLVGFGTTVVPLLVFGGSGSPVTG